MAPEESHRPEDLLAAAGEEAPPCLYVLLVVSLAFAVVFLPGEVAGAAQRRVGRFRVRDQLVSDLRTGVLLRGRQASFAATTSVVARRRRAVLPDLASDSRARALFEGDAPQARRLLTVVLFGAVASAVAMALLYTPGVDPSRIYYSADTRATGLLCGAALAFLWSPRSDTVLRMRGSLPVGDGSGIAEVPHSFSTSLASPHWARLVLSLNDSSPFLYRGGFALVGLATTATIMAVVHPYAHERRLLGRLHCAGREHLLASTSGTGLCSW